MIAIQAGVFDAIVAYAHAAAPLEACGYCAGSGNVITRWYPLVNVDRSSDHYSMDPREQFAVIRQVREEGLDLIAAWHSHPASPARPSAEDIRLAYDPDIRYIIVSLLDAAPVMKSFLIAGGTVTPEELEVQQ